METYAENKIITIIDVPEDAEKRQMDWRLFVQQERIPQSHVVNNEYQRKSFSNQFVRTTT